MKGAVLVALSSVLSVILTLLIQVVLARKLAPDDYGNLITIISVLTIFSTFSTVGAELYLLRRYGSSIGDGNLVSSLVYKIIFVSALFSSVAMYMIFLIIDIFGSEYFLIPCVFAFAFLCLAGVASQIEKNYNKIALYQIVQPLSRMALIILFFYIFNLRASVDLVLLIIGLSTIIIFAVIRKDIVSIYAGRVGSQGRLINNKVKNKSKEVLIIIRGSLLYTIVAALFSIYIYAPVLIANKIIGSYESGIYGLALSIVLAIYVIPGVLYQKMVLPYFHRVSSRDDESLLKVFASGNGLMLVCGVLVMVVVYFSSVTFIDILFGVKYMHAAEVLQILCFAIPFRFMTSNSGALLSTGRSIKYKVYCMLFIVPLSIACFYYFSINYDFIYLAYLFVISEILTFFIFMLVISKTLYGKKAWLGWFDYKWIMR